MGGSTAHSAPVTGATPARCKGTRQGAPGATPAWEMFRCREPTLLGSDGQTSTAIGASSSSSRRCTGRGIHWPRLGGSRGAAARLRPPADPRTEPWPTEVASDVNQSCTTSCQNVDADRKKRCDGEPRGLFVQKRGAGGSWSRTQIGDGAAGRGSEARPRRGRRLLATSTVAGASVVITAGKRPLDATVIETGLTGGHALGGRLRRRRIGRARRRLARPEAGVAITSSIARGRCDRKGCRRRRMATRSDVAV